MNITARFSDIVRNIDKHTFHIMGCGAIGSTLAVDLVRMGAQSFVLYDMDTVSIENIGVSEYTLADIDRHKLNALDDILRSINTSIETVMNPKKITNNSHLIINTYDFIILCFDNMAVRKLVATKACKANAYFLIDGRMGAEVFQMYAYIKPDIKNYLKHWYSDKEADDEPCTARTTTYCRSLASSIMLNSIKRMLQEQDIPNELIFDFHKLYMGIA